LYVTEVKKTHFFVCKLIVVVNRKFGNFLKTTLTRIIHYDPSRVITTSFLNVRRVTNNRGSSRVTDLSHPNTGSTY